MSPDRLGFKEFSLDLCVVDLDLKGTNPGGIYKFRGLDHVENLGHVAYVGGLTLRARSLRMRLEGLKVSLGTKCPKEYPSEGNSLQDSKRLTPKTLRVFKVTKCE